MHLARYFLERVDSYAGKEAFCIYRGEEKQSILYGEIKRRITALALALTSRISRGDRVAIWSENRPDWCVAYMALTALGCVAVPVDSELGGDECANIYTSSGSALIFVSRKTVQKLAGEKVSPERVISFDEQDYGAMIGGTGEGFRVPDVLPDDLASIIYTSGTTGTPKGVMLTHRNFISDAEAVEKTGIISSGDNVLGILPLHHTYAFMCTFILPFLLGATITQPASLKGPDLTHAIRDSGVTIMIGVPQLLELFYQSIRRNIEAMSFLKRLMAHTMLVMGGFFRERFDLNLGRLLFRSVHGKFGSQFRFMTSGGARLEPAIMKGLEAVGFTILEGYGLTETSPVVTFNPVEKRKPGSAGKALDGAEIKIVPREEGAREGEIMIKGDMVMKGYYGMPEETAKVLGNEWFHSGDLGYMDHEGFVFITGRQKEVIVLSSGKNIYPEEVEKEYQRLPLISEIGIFQKGESLHAVIVPDFEQAKKMKVANIHEALKWDVNGVSIRLPSYTRIKGYTLFSEPLPRTRLGKLRRFQLAELAKRAGEGKQEISQRREPLDATAEKVIKALQVFLPEPSDPGLNDNLELDLGIDSLKRIELTVELEKAFSRALPETFMVDVQKVSDLVEKLKQTESEGGAPPEEPARTFRDILFKEPSPEALKDIGLKGNGFVDLAVRVLIFFLRMISRLWLGTEMRGIEKIPPAPFIMVSNHASYLDSFLIAIHLPFGLFRKLFFQGAQEYFQGRLLRCFARAAHVIPIDPDAYMTSALSLSAHVLREGRSLFIFPEGGRSIDGSVMPFRKGIGILSAELGVPLVPVKLTGTYASMPRGAFFPKKEKVMITIGSPLTSDEIEGLKSQESDPYQAIADRARDRVMAL